MAYYTYSMMIMFLFIKTIEIKSFKITSMSSCAPFSLVYRRMIGISLVDCVEACSDRPGCAALNYYRKRKSCHLLTSTSDTTTTRSCVYIDKLDFGGPGFTAVCPCSTNDVCIVNLDGYFVCGFEECERLWVDNGAVRGNMNTVGSTAQYQCDPSFQASTPTTVTCLETGQWSNIPSCTIDCGEPNVGMNAVLVPGLTIMDSIRTYICNEGFVDPLNQKLVSIDTTCLPSGTWSVVNVQCVRGNHIGYGCNQDTDCANTMSSCIDNKCFCDVLYDYNTFSDDCIRVCESLTDNFDIFPETYIVNYNGHRMYNVSVTDCLDLCRMNDTCYYIEDRHDGCMFGHVTVEMLYDADPDAIGHSYNGYTVYSRLCEPIYTTGP